MVGTSTRDILGEEILSNSYQKWFAFSIFQIFIITQPIYLLILSYYVNYYTYANFKLKDALFSSKVEILY